ncbi:hypothetical protein Lal_00032884 [Lupinus albus]|nr:hypothetical protein Lal_00032884 [Lupinus albus]
MSLNFKEGGLVKDKFFKKLEVLLLASTTLARASTVENVRFYSTREPCQISIFYNTHRSKDCST